MGGKSYFLPKFEGRGTLVLFSQQMYDCHIVMDSL